MGPGTELDGSMEDGELFDITLSPQAINAAEQSGTSWGSVGRTSGSLQGSSPHLTLVLDSGNSSILQLNEEDRRTKTSDI